MIEIRDYRPEDKNFILATFLRGLYYGDSWFSSVPKDIFMSNYSAVVEALINSPRVATKVMCLADDIDVVVGYSMMSADFQTIHWVFVKKDWRNKGIASRLLPQRPTAVTHLTALGKSLLTKFQSPVIFNPFALKE
jgi:GNAT superfamily N-acetyltransferase